MNGQMTKRLTELRAEFESGQARLGQLEVERAYLRERLLMVRGAIDVLEDLLTEQTAQTADAAEATGPAGDGSAGALPGNGRVREAHGNRS